MRVNNVQCNYVEMKVGPGKRKLLKLCLIYDKLFSYSSDGCSVESSHD